MTDGPLVRIEYCVPCSALPYAVSLTTRVLEELAGQIGGVEVVPGTGGIFDVHVDGERVFTKSMLGRYPDPDDVMPLLRARIVD
jgi:selenoprotein W-related protein